jgi:hypothetical protein
VGLTACCERNPKRPLKSLFAKISIRRFALRVQAVIAPSDDGPLAEIAPGRVVMASSGAPSRATRPLASPRSRLPGLGSTEGDYGCRMLATRPAGRSWVERGRLRGSRAHRVQPIR